MHDGTFFQYFFCNPQSQKENRRRLKSIMSTEEKQVPKVDEEKVAEKTAKTNENEEEIGSLKL